MRAILLALFVLAVTPASALAGGWATVGLSSTPEGVDPGQPWVVDLTVLQHGREETPLDGVQPSITISRDGERRTFEASPTGKPGVYRARVIFPSAGAWRYSANDGFAGTHGFPPVQIGGGEPAAAAPADDGPDLGLAALIAAVAGLAAGIVALVLGRSRRVGRSAQA